MGRQKKFSQPCELAFEGFAGHFEKAYGSEAQRAEAYAQFCVNYARLQDLDRTAAQVDITEFMDQDFDQLTQDEDIMKFDPKTRKNNTLCYAACMATDPLSVVAKLPQSVDLREQHLVTDAKRQGKCGACWGFSAITLMENAMLNDRAIIAKKSKFWAKELKNLSLSEQFLISNDFGGKDNYCKGGQVFHALTNVLYNASTVETTAHFPYDPKTEQNLKNWENKVRIEPKLPKQDHYVPFKVFEDQFVSQAKTPVVRLYNSPKKFDPRTIDTIKSYLARGIAVGFYMKIVPKDSFYYYRGGKVQHQACRPFRVNHAVTAIGYGTKDKKEVWIVKNSWGTRWGDNGVFFVEIGKDSYCIEHHAYAVVPKHFDLGLEAPLKLKKEKRASSWALDEDVVLSTADYVWLSTEWIAVLSAAVGLLVLVGGAYATHLLFKKYKQPLLGAEEAAYKSEM